MNITTTNTVANSVYKTSIGVELSPLEDQYVKSYGEPMISLTGLFPYTPSEPQAAPGQIELDLTTDIGSPGVPTIVNVNEGLGGAIELGAQGTFVTALTDTVGGFHGASEVVGDFEFVARLDGVDGGFPSTGNDPSANDGFRLGLMLWDGDESDDPSIILGWGSHNSAYNIALWNRANKGGAYSEVNSVAKPSPAGIYLRLTRVSATLTAAYSLDNGETWATLGVATVSKQTYRIGLFANSGDVTPIVATFSNVSLTNTPVEDVNSFTITGTKQVLIRGSQPHTFMLDGKIDSQASEKVAGWAAEIKDRLTTAIQDLLADNDNPTSTNTSVTEQV